MPNLTLKPTIGVAPGECIQFARGRWPEAIGPGVALSEEAFNAIEPLLGTVWPAWTSDRRYGVTELPSATIAALVRLLRLQATVGKPASSDSRTELFSELAEWLDAERKAQEPVTILGIQHVPTGVSRPAARDPLRAFNVAVCLC